ncbi:MAG: hypothetical protein COA63_011795 [Methylophaga sp.]|nr:hypothetical protein [Methylophaga sp.]
MENTGSCAELKLILSSLTEKEGQVLSARFGLNEQEAQTLEQVGKRLGVTRERIRQIEAKALRKLRQKAMHLKAQRDDYLD